MGERYFEAKAPFSRTVTNCVSRVKKAGIFTDDDIQVDETVTVTAAKIVSAIVDLKRRKNE